MEYAAVPSAYLFPHKPSQEFLILEYCKDKVEVAMKDSCNPIHIRYLGMDIN